MQSPDTTTWEDKIEKDYKCFEKFEVFTLLPHSELPKHAKVMSTTWAMKRKTKVKLCRVLNACWYEQLEGKQYHTDSIAAWVTNPNTIQLVLPLMAMIPYWTPVVIDAEDAFLWGKFTGSEQMHITVLD